MDGGRTVTLALPAGTVRVGRTSEGVARIRAADDVGLAAGLGWAHAHDRLVQMELVRLAAAGRLCECLRDDAATLAVDVFMRRMGFARRDEADLARLTAEARAVLEAYAEGVNAWTAENARPLELQLVGHRPEPWRAEDALATVKLMSYLGLAQTQADAEKVIVEALRGGTDRARLQRLFRPHLDEVDDALVELLRQTRVAEPVTPPEVRFLSALPRLVASNNWAVAAGRSASGGALQANDPHLEVNRLPAVWYEMVGEAGGAPRLGITMPGVPGLVMGRTREVSFGFTYGFLDLVDYFVEELRGGLYRYREEWRRPEARRERILRQDGPAHELHVFSTLHGTLETDGGAALADGHYLCRAWAADLSGTAPSVNAFVRLLRARDVEEAADAVRDVTISCNWLLADRGGRIAYQQSGPIPRRRHSGLFPVRGWTGEHDWQGLHGRDALARQVDPPEGILATANDDRNAPGGPRGINLSMGGYRVERIRALLAGRERLTLADMMRIQGDLHSLQAERFMGAFAPLLPDTPAARLLREWDLRYDEGSRGAVLFEAVYAALLREVFGRGLFGLAAWDALAGQTSLLADYFHVFDDALLGEDPSWFGEEGREACFRRVLADVLAEAKAADPRPWGEVHAVTMTNVFFGGALPGFLGFDHGPVALPGSRATVVQGAVFRAHGRLTSFAPSWRYVADLSTAEAHTALPGGPSGRRLSEWYLTDLARWRRFAYKTLAARDEGGMS